MPVMLDRTRAERADALESASRDLTYAAGQLARAAELERQGMALALVEDCVSRACEGLDRCCAVVCPDAEPLEVQQ